jgi:fumarylacetoacetate (FAA) hydrolase
MFLATLPGPTRDGRLHLVSSDHRRMVPAGAAVTILDALERWSTVEAELRREADALNRGECPGAVPFDEERCLAPLPRTYGFFDGSAFLSHVVRARRARGDEMPESAKRTPLVYQGVADNALPWNAPLDLVDEAFGGDFEGEFAVVTTDVPRGTGPADMARYCPLVMMFNDVTLREIVKAEIETKFGFLQSKPNNAYAPLAVTVDEFGSAWTNGRLALDLEVQWNGERFGNPNGREMHFSFYELVAHVCRTRPLSAGTIVGSGTVSNEDVSRGFACLTERRYVEAIEKGKPSTRWLKPGDRVSMTVRHGDRVPFGRIEQVVR